MNIHYCIHYETPTKRSLRESAVTEDLGAEDQTRDFSMLKLNGTKATAEEKVFFKRTDFVQL